MGIANVINVTGSAGGGEIIRELINSSDGQGLHFDGAAGNIDLATPPDLGTKFSFEFVIKADSTGASAKIIDFGDGGRFSIEHNTTGLQVKSAGSGWYTIQTPSMLADLDVHHMVVTVDNTALTLYDNSNEVATATIAAPDIDSCADARIGTYFDFAASECFHGSMYRCRFYNKALTQAEVDTAYQKADVPFESQYGSQTSLVDANASTFVGTSIYGWVKYGNNTIANTSNQLVITYVDNVQGAYHYLRDSTDLTTNLTVGKKYKLKIDAKYAGGSAGVKLRIADGVATTEFATLTTSLTTYEVEFTAQSATGCYINLGDMSASNVVTLDNYYVYSCGCVSDFDLAFANPTQSLMVQDRAGVADGTATAGVSQTQKIVQLNSTSAVVASSAFTPTDGHIATDCLTLPKAGGTPSLSFDYGSVYNLLDGAVTTSQETTHLAGRNIAFHVNANTANAMTISSAGLVSIGNVTATKLLHLKSADPVIRLEDSDPDGVYSEIDGAGGDLIISCDGGNGAANSDIMFKVDGSTKMNIDSAGLVTSTLSSADTNTAGVALKLDHATSGSSAVGFGTLIRFDGERTGSTSDGMGTMGFVADSMSASRVDGAFVVNTGQDGSYTERLRISSTGLATFSAGLTVSAGFTTLGSMSELTIASGGITITSSVHIVDTQGDAASDNLNTINGGSTGSILVLTTADSSRDVTLKDDSDNLRLAGDCSLASSNDSITLIKNGSIWREVSRSING